MRPIQVTLTSTITTHRPAPQRLAGLPAPDRGPLGRGNLALVTSGGARAQGAPDDQGFYAYGRLRRGIIGVERSFTGQQKDFGSGLIYFNARYYDPEIGQFISPDTIVPDPGNLLDYNRYAYARLNPMKYTDPTGHCVNATTQQAGDSIGYDNEECWRLANTIANLWDSTDYWSNRFTSKAVFLHHVANNAHNGTDFFQAQMDFYLQSDAYRRQQPNLPASAASTGDPMCGNDRACQAVVQHALYMEQKCRGIDCIGVGNDMVGVVATGSIAAVCIPASSCPYFTNLFFFFCYCLNQHAANLPNRMNLLLQRRIIDLLHAAMHH